MIATRFAYANEAVSNAVPQQSVRRSIRLRDSDTYQGVVSDPISLHKYLYANADPVLKTDPTGHMALMEMVVGSGMRGILAASTLIAVGAIWLGYEARNTFFLGEKLTPPEQAKVNTAITLMEDPGLGGAFQSYANRAKGLRIRTLDMPNWGWSPEAFRTVCLTPSVFSLDDRLFTSILLHETAHTRQFPHFLGTEHGAYQVQSDYLRAIGFVGTVQQVKAMLGPTPTWEDVNFLRDMADSFKERGVTNPAITPD